MKEMQYIKIKRFMILEDIENKKVVEYVKIKCDIE